MALSITHIKHKDIDRNLWDLKVKSSKNTTVYAYSWFLDIVSPSWEALVTEDYKYIMPLPKFKKYFIYYIKRPVLLQKIGIISNDNISDKIIEQFFRNIPSKFKIVDIPIFNQIYSQYANIQISKKTNYELSLNNSYSEIYKLYSKNHKKNIKRALKNNLTITEKFDIDLFLKLRVKDDKFHIYKNFENEHLHQLKEILKYAKKKNICKMYFVKTLNEEYIASIFFIIQNNIAIKFSTRTALGKKMGAGYLIIDNFIKLNQKQNILLDFVGSDIKGIAYFNKGFGSAKKIYSNVYISRLNPILNFFKK